MGLCRDIERHCRGIFVEKFTKAPGLEINKKKCIKGYKNQIYRKIRAMN